MIRRSPTRVELKLEDLADFDYIQKFEKKKAPNAVPGTIGGISAADAQKFIRQDRIGFRPIRTGTGTGATGSGGSNGTFYPAGSTGSSGAVDVIPTTAEASTSTIEGQAGDITGTSTSGNAAATNRSNVADMDISGDDVDAVDVTPSVVTGESINVSNVDMSLDESL